MRARPQLTLLAPNLSSHFAELGADPLARFSLRFEISDLLRQHGGTRQPHVPSASVFVLDSFERHIWGEIGHDQQHGHDHLIALREDASRGPLLLMPPV